MKRANNIDQQPLYMPIYFDEQAEIAHAHTLLLILRINTWTAYS